MSDCIFCKIVAGEVPSQKILETKKVLAFMDIAAVNKGDALVIPKKHYADFIETPDEELSEVIRMTRKIAEAVKKALNPHGYNIMINNGRAAGQAIFHVHAHIIPRFSDDGVKHWHKKQISAEELKKIKERIVNSLPE